jgi:Uma2 family endonuclease
MSLKEVLPTYTVSDYLQWEGDWELWEGHPVAMAPSPTPEHQNSGTNLVVEFASQLKAKPCSNRCRVFYELDWHIDDTTVVRPDLMIYCHDMPKEKWIVNAPTLVAEILSPSSRDRDEIGKKALYAENGVKYYLIADPESKNLDLFILIDREYQEISISSNVVLTEECEVSIVADNIFE